MGLERGFVVTSLYSLLLPLQSLPAACALETPAVGVGVGTGRDAVCAVGDGWCVLLPSKEKCAIAIGDKLLNNLPLCSGGGKQNEARPIDGAEQAARRGCRASKPPPQSRSRGP